MQPTHSIKHRGILVSACSIEGERREDDVFPAHPNGIRLSRTRFLLLYATRGFRGTDEDRSIIYQVRADSFEGQVLKEGILARASDHWIPFDDGQSYHLDNGHPVAFGVPKGALIHGKPADLMEFSEIVIENCSVFDIEHIP